MKTKIFLLLTNIILMLGCFGLFYWGPKYTETLSYPLASQGKLEKVMAAFEQTEENFFTDLRFNQVTLMQDADTGTFYLPLDMEEETWEAGELSSGQADVELFFVDAFSREDKQTAIKEGTRYQFLAVQGNRYRSYEIVFTGLPIVSIETTETAETAVFGGTVRFWEADSKRDWAYSNILEAHIRGNTSQIYPKKGYKITLKTQDRDGNVVEDKRSLFGLREDDEYILNAMYTDSSKIRDALCADIWSGMGASVDGFQDMYLGTRMTYVELFFNGQYWGLYALMEPVDSKQLDLNKEQEKGTVEYAYKSSYPQSLSAEELEQSTVWAEEMAGYKLKGTYSQITRENWQPLLDYLNWKNTDQDEEFLKGAETLVDAENVMNIWVYLQAVMGIDNRVKNMFYVAKYVDGDYRMYLAPWDMDLSLGDTLQDSVNEYPWDVGLNPLIYRERINFEPGDRMIELDAASSRELVAQIWRKARQGVLSDTYLQEKIDALSHQVLDSGAGGRDQYRWGESKSGADYEKLKIMTCYRMELLDTYFYDNLEAYLKLGYS